MLAPGALRFCHATAGAAGINTSSPEPRGPTGRIGRDDMGGLLSPLAGLSPCRAAFAFLIRLSVGAFAGARVSAGVAAQPAGAPFQQIGELPSSPHAVRTLRSRRSPAPYSASLNSSTIEPAISSGSGSRFQHQGCAVSAARRLAIVVGPSPKAREAAGAACDQAACDQRGIGSRCFRSATAINFEKSFSKNWDANCFVFRIRVHSYELN